ncbi:unnamed protein product, partial [marine sediment metagenome]
MNPEFEQCLKKNKIREFPRPWESSHNKNPW